MRGVMARGRRGGARVVACRVDEVDAEGRVAVEFGALFVLRLAPVALNRGQRGAAFKRQNSVRLRMGAGARG